MMFTDTHCHWTAEPLASRHSAVLAEAQAVGVNRLIVPATCPQDWDAVLACLSLPYVRAVAVGVHPWFVEQVGEQDWARLERLIQDNPRVLIGEIGLDAYATPARDAQLMAFERQLALAQRHQRPIIAHNVKSTASLITCIQRMGFTQGGIIHAYSGSVEEAMVLIKMGFKIGIGSLLLNPNTKKVRQAVVHLPLSALLLETDSPYMRPHNSNTPANIRSIAQVVADLRGISLAVLAEQVEENLDSMLNN